MASNITGYSWQGRCVVCDQRTQRVCRCSQHVCADSTPTSEDLTRMSCWVRHWLSCIEDAEREGPERVAVPVDGNCPRCGQKLHNRFSERSCLMCGYITDAEG